jgi:hypothetical protein
MRPWGFESRTSPSLRRRFWVPWKKRGKKEDNPERTMKEIHAGVVDLLRTGRKGVLAADEEG